MTSLFLQSSTRRPRQLRSNSRYKWVRLVAGNSWWARPYLPNVTGVHKGQVNLGLFNASDYGGSLAAAERAAAMTAREFVRRCSWPGAYAWEVLDQMKREGKIKSDVHPTWVVPVAGGFAARRLIRSTGRVIWIPGPFSTGAEAHRAMRDRMAARDIGRVRGVSWTPRWWGESRG
jgi:hypothetical protein